MKLSICGKGGSGKSVVTCLLANRLLKKGFRVLVVDSDESNISLYRTLGFDQPPAALMELAGGKKNLKAQMGQPNILAENEITLDKIPPAYSQKKDGLILVCIGKIFQALEGCACPMGALSREFLGKVRLKDSEFLIVDMEAGVEHFGRGIETSLEAVLLVIDPTYESIHMAERIKTMASGVQKGVRALLNKVDSDRTAAKLTFELNTRGIEVIGAIPNDPVISTACLDGYPLEPDTAGFQADKILDFLLQGSKRKETYVSEHSLY